MTKILRSFRFDDLVLDRLEKLVWYYNNLPSSDRPAGNKIINKTDIIEFLINSKFDDLAFKGEIRHFDE